MTFGEKKKSAKVRLDISFYCLTNNCGHWQAPNEVSYANMYKILDLVSFSNLINFIVILGHSVHLQEK